MSDFGDIVEVDGRNKAETDEAVLYTDDEDVKVWLPKSQMEEWPEKGKEGTFHIKEWIAIEKELI